MEKEFQRCSRPRYILIVIDMAMAPCPSTGEVGKILLKEILSFDEGHGYVESTEVLATIVLVCSLAYGLESGGFLFFKYACDDTL